MYVEEELELFGLNWLRAKLLPGDTLKADSEADIAEWSDEDWEMIAERCRRGHDWNELLTFRPQFTARCEWTTFSGDDWCSYLCGHPQFATLCDWTKLDRKNWGQLLIRHPQFRDKCPFLPVTAE